MKSFIKCRPYHNSIPRKNELAIITYKKLGETSVTVSLDEYDGQEALIFLNELTRRKRIKSLSKMCPIGKQVVAEVIESDETCISLSLRHVTEKDEILFREYVGLNRKLNIILKKFAIKTQLELESLYESMVWPIHVKTNIDQEKSEYNIETRLEQHPFKALSNRDTLSKLDLEPDLLNLFLVEHEQLFGKEIITESFTAILISYKLNGLAVVKETLQKCLDWSSKQKCLDLSSKQKCLDLSSKQKCLDWSSKQKCLDWSSKQKCLDWSSSEGIKLNIYLGEIPKYTFKFTGSPSDKETIEQWVNYCQQTLRDEFDVVNLA